MATLINTYYGSVSSENSYLLDGVDEYLGIPNSAILNNVIMGTGKKFTINAVFRKTTNPANNITFFSRYGSSAGDQSLLFMMLSTGEFLVAIRDGSEKIFRTTNTFNSLTNWYAVSFVYDGVTPANCKFYVDGVDEPISLNTLTSTINTTSGTYTIGVLDFSPSMLNHFDGNMYQISVVDKDISLADHITWRNSGKPLKPEDTFGANMKYQLIGQNNFWNGSDHVNTDNISGLIATSVNMEKSDYVSDSP